MVDKTARLIALRLIKRMSAGELSVIDFETHWPRNTTDLGVRSIGFWIWTLFDDDDDGLIQRNRDEESLSVIERAAIFLDSNVEYQAKSSAGPMRKFRDFLNKGIEWIDCDLPWHSEWPNSPKVSNDEVNAAGS